MIQKEDKRINLHLIRSKNKFSRLTELPPTSKKGKGVDLDATAYFQQAGITILE